MVERGRIPRQLRRAEPDFNWKWTKELGEVIRDHGKYTNGWVVETPADGAVQGGIIYSTDATSLIDHGPDGESIPAVYVHVFATAPRNRDRLTEPHPGMYRGVGTALMRIAISHSYLIGGGGRVNLTSVPHPATMEWYEDFQFSRMEEIGDRIAYELPVEIARGHLAEVGLA